MVSSRATSRTKDSPPGVDYKFIDLFAGVGGFHQALHRLGAECVFASEWDEAARLTYEHNFRGVSPRLFSDGGKLFNRDITEITQPQERLAPKALSRRIRAAIPDFDVLCAGFPCQPFSQAGHKRGFKDDRGNLFHDIMKIIEARRPKAIFLENVRHLLTHDNTRTINVIREKLEPLYGKVFEIPVKASDHGLPQHRPRVFIIGFREPFAQCFFEAAKDMPPRSLELTMSDVMGGEVTNLDGSTREIGFTLRVGGKQSPITDRRNWDGYWVRKRGDPKPREVRLTPREGLLMQGFDRDFEFPPDVPFAERMKQLGNSVAVPAVEDYARQIFRALKAAEKYGSPRLGQARRPR